MALAALVAAPWRGQVENHFLNPAVMIRTVRINSLLVRVSVLIAGAISHWRGGTSGAVAALLAIPTAASLQAPALEIWRATSTAPALPAQAQGDASPYLF